MHVAVIVVDVFVIPEMGFELRVRNSSYRDRSDSVVYTVCILVIVIVIIIP